MGLEGALAWASTSARTQVGSDRPNSPSLYSLQQLCAAQDSVLHSCSPPQDIPPQRQPAGQGCAIGAGLCLLPFRVIPWTVLSPGRKLWQSSFSALLPVPGGIAPATGVAQPVSPGGPTDGLRLSNALWSNSPSPVLSETGQKHHWTSSDLSVASPSCFPVPFLWLQHSLMT